MKTILKFSGATLLGLGGFLLFFIIRQTAITIGIARGFDNHHLLLLILALIANTFVIALGAIFVRKARE